MLPSPQAAQSQRGNAAIQIEGRRIALDIVSQTALQFFQGFAQIAAGEKNFFINHTDFIS